MPRFTSRPRGFLIAVAALAAGLGLALPGCGAATGTVKGKVTVEGEPVNSGTVSIRSATGLVVTGMIQSDGSYSVENVPVGTGAVSVSVVDDKFGEYMSEVVGRSKSKESKDVSSRSRPPKGKIKDISEFSRADMKYSSYESSGLTVTVQGTTTFDIDMKKPPKK